MRERESVRRTATTDITRPEGPGGPLVLEGRARDLRTTADGTTAIAATASYRARVDYLDRQRVLAITTDPPRPAVSALVGRSAMSGFRRALRHDDPDLPEESPLLEFLLDDLPVVVLISGNAVDTLDRPPMGLPDIAVRPQDAENICAGFISGGTIMATVRAGGRPPRVTGPVAAPLSSPTDPHGWHDLPALQPNSMRRARRIDVCGHDPVRIAAWFRDSYVRPDNVETVIHEYELTAEASREADALLWCRATPRVLPFLECSVASALAERAPVMRLASLRDAIRTESAGVTGCTHLADMIAGLSSVAGLAALLDT